MITEIKETENGYVIIRDGYEIYVPHDYTGWLKEEIDAFLNK